MLGQLNNSLHYNKVNSDPTPEHFEGVKKLGRQMARGRADKSRNCYMGYQFGTKTRGGFLAM